METVSFARPGVGVGMAEVSLSVVVPEGARINPPFGFLQQPGLTPLGQRMIRYGDINPLIRHGKENPKLPSVKADRWGPDAAAGLDLGIARMGHLPHSVIDQLPINHVS